jgi:hypothetical protein
LVKDACITGAYLAKNLIMYNYKRHNMRLSHASDRRVKYTTVSIPIALHERIKGLIEGKGFKSVSDYVTFILREIVVAHETEIMDAPFNVGDTELIKKRLKALGYI